MNDIKGVSEIQNQNTATTVTQDYFGRASKKGSFSDDDLRALRNMGIEVADRTMLFGSEVRYIRVPADAYTLINDSQDTFKFELYPRNVEADIWLRDTNALNISELKAELAFHEYWVSSDANDGRLTSSSSAELDLRADAIESLQLRLHEEENLKVLGPTLGENPNDNVVTVNTYIDLNDADWGFVRELDTQSGEIRELPPFYSPHETTVPIDRDKLPPSYVISAYNETLAISSELLRTKIDVSKIHNGTAKVMRSVELIQNSPDYADVGIYVKEQANGGEWKFAVSLDKSNGNIFHTVQYSPDKDTYFDEPENPPGDDVLSAFYQAKPKAVAILNQIRFGNTPEHKASSYLQEIQRQSLATVLVSWPLDKTYDEVLEFFVGDDFEDQEEHGYALADAYEHHGGRALTDIVQEAFDSNVRFLQQFGISLQGNNALVGGVPLKSVEKVITHFREICAAIEEGDTQAIADRHLSAKNLLDAVAPEKPAQSKDVTSSNLTM